MKRAFLVSLLLLSSFIVRSQDVFKADSLFNAKEYSKAYFIYKDIESNGAADVKILRRMGYCLSISENMAQAAEGYFKKALKLDPSDLASNYLLGKLLLENKARLINKLDKEQRLSLADKCLTYTAMHDYEDSKQLLIDLKKERVK